MAFPDEDDADSAPAPLWPSAADGSSGLRGKTLDEQDDEAALRAPGASDSGSSPYQVLEPLGTTAYGRVFRARHLAQDREVALHYFTLDDDSEGNLSRALPLAVAKCAQLTHPNVIAVEGHGRDERNGSYFLVTEPLEGIALADHLADVGSLTLSRALSIMQQIGRALRAAHKLGIVHGALTPANVRVVSASSNDAADTQGQLVRVVGFGCTTLSARVTVQGDPYQAPEVRRDQPVDARADVFAVGALLYRMLTGRAPAPIKGGVAEAPSVAAFSDEPVPRELDELVARCMDKDPATRLSDMVELTRDLRVIARNVDMTVFSEERALLRNSSSIPLDASPSDSDSSGSLFGAEGTGRRGLAWIIAGLLLALAAVWLVWEASTRSHPEQQPVPDGRLAP